MRTWTPLVKSRATIKWPCRQIRCYSRRDSTAADPRSNHYSETRLRTKDHPHHPAEREWELSRAYSHSHFADTADLDVTTSKYARRIKVNEAWETHPNDALHEDPNDWEYGNSNSYTSGEGWTRPRFHGQPSLPLPPMLRPAPKLKDRFMDLDFQGVYRRTNRKTLKQQIKAAPFATTFAQNPYAHALAMPVRMCCLTGTRLPSSCLVDFHIQEKPDSPDLSLLPLSLVAARVPANKPEDKRTAAESEAVAAHEAELRRPDATATYIVGRQAALQFVSDGNKKRFKFFGYRTQKMLSDAGRDPPEWRADMAGFVLAELRKVVVKKLLWHFRSKVTKDNPGLVADLPGGSDITRLNDVDGVMCVLRLTPSPEPPNLLTESKDNSAEPANPPTLLPPAVPAPNLGPLTAAIKNVDSDKASVLTDPMSISKVPNLVDNNYTRNHKENEYTWNHEDITELDTDTPNPSAPTSPTMPRGSTYRKKKGWWLADERKTFLADLLPLPPPIKPATLYFPTLHYRNRRVPLYSLPVLLGEKATRKLLEGTVFAESEWLTVTSSTSTIQPQLWLGKLAAYVAERKGSSVRI